MVFGIQPKRNYRSYKKKHVENEKNESAKVVYVYRWQVTLPDSLLSIKRGYLLSTPFESKRKCASEKKTIYVTHPNSYLPLLCAFKRVCRFNNFCTYVWTILIHTSRSAPNATHLLQHYCSVLFLLSLCVCVYG